MTFKNQIRLILFSILIAFSLVSCGSTNLFKPSPEPAETGLVPDEPNQLSGLESEMALLRQEHAALKSQVTEKDGVIQKLETDVSRLEKKMAALENTKQTAEPVKLEYTVPAELYKRARNLLLEKKYVDAANLFKTFIIRYPKNSLADNAVYWLAECHYSMGEYEKAAAIFKDLENQYPKSEKVPDAILKAGYSYLFLDDTNRAGHFLKKVLKRYPFSPAAEKAQIKLGEFK